MPSLFSWINDGSHNFADDLYSGKLILTCSKKLIGSLNPSTAMRALLYRELSMNAFDQPDESDDGTFSINEPFPDISSLIGEDLILQSQPNARTMAAARIL